MRLLYCAILIALLPCIAFAQALDIRGVVSDSSSGEHIPFANVILVGTTRGAASNAYGFYLITSVPPSTYQIAASAIGLNIINVYNRQNVFYFERTTGKRINMLGFFPSLNVTLEFLP